MGYGFKYACGYFPAFCEVGMALIAQSTNEFNDKDRLKVFFGHYPGGSSYRSWSYIWECYSEKVFKNFDYGTPELNF